MNSYEVAISAAESRSSRNVERDSLGGNIDRITVVELVLPLLLPLLSLSLFWRDGELTIIITSSGQETQGRTEEKDEWTESGCSVRSPPNIYSAKPPIGATGSHRPPRSQPIAVLDPEKQVDWTVHATQELCQKRNGSTIRNIRHRVMSMYRRLFAVIFLVNLAVAASFAATGVASLDRIASACLGNLTAAVVIRQEHFINLLFRSFSSVPKSWPLSIRRYCAKIYSLGGVHSGCALFAVVWLVWLTGGLTYSYVAEHAVSPASRFPKIDLTIAR